jgi:Lipid A 3-O-deacylase (PagL)
MTSPGPAGTAATTLLFVVLILTAPAAAQPGVVPPAEGDSSVRTYERGSIDWSVLGGGALPIDLSSARPDRRLWLVAIEIGRIMSDRHGPGALAGHFEMLLQAMPIIVRGPADFWGVGLSPLFVRWNFSGTTRVRPYAEASAGLMLIDWETPGPGRVTRNFTEQAGVGLRVGSASRRSAMIGYRFQHISNGSRTLPSPGIDTHLVYVGFSSVR